VSLSSIVDVFVSTLEEIRPSLDLETATEFLMIAAILLELKAHRLLPQSDDVDLDEELALWEERDLLLARLLECKTYKDAAQMLTRLMDAAGRSWPRPGGLEEPFASLAPDPLAGVTPAKLRDAYKRAVAPKPIHRVGLEHIHQVRVSVSEVVSELTERLPDMGRVSFAQLTAGLVERLEIIVRFLAVLELYKRGSVDLAQADHFADIEVSWIGDGDAAAAPVDEYLG
jgi:segregation and condensation protein A